MPGPGSSGSTTKLRRGGPTIRMMCCSDLQAEASRSAAWTLWTSARLTARGTSTRTLAVQRPSCCRSIMGCGLIVRPEGPRLLPALGCRRAPRDDRLPARLQRGHRPLSPPGFALNAAASTCGPSTSSATASARPPRRLRFDHGQLRPRRHLDRFAERERPGLPLIGQGHRSARSSPCSAVVAVRSLPRRRHLRGPAGADPGNARRR